MKSTYKILSLGAMAFLAASCADDLNTEFLGSEVTPGQKEDVLKMDPEKALAGVTGAFQSLNQAMSTFSNHFDYGYPSLALGLDLQTEDLIGLQSGYNWHTYWEGYTSPNNNGTPSTMMWYEVYGQIFTCNAVINGIDHETTDSELKFFLANGLALRAFDYFTLVQAYQFNYTNNPNALGLPLIYGEAAESDGTARSTVAETYAMIEGDLDTAISLLESTDVTPADVIADKPYRLISLASAYGLRARVHLVKHEYAKAAEMADKAIAAFSGRPYTIDEVSKPSFTSLNDPSWMWGLAIAETDRVVTTGIVNYPSFLVSFADGYVNVGSWKYCGLKLYSRIPQTDVRKGWFLDDNYSSPNLSSAQQAYLGDYVNPDLDFQAILDAGETSSSDIVPQTNVKFNSYNGVLGQSVNSNDFPFMRVEEMYYIKAEGLAMSGNPSAGLSVLTDFVKTYRNPGYMFTGTSAEEIQEEIWWQRRMEFWGEGLAFFDVMRLNKGIDRRDNHHPYSFRYVIEPNDPVLIYCVPEREITANAKISYDDGNQTASRPTPVE